MRKIQLKSELKVLRMLIIRDHSVLEKVGFEGEVVLRKYFVVKGNMRDMVMFSVLSSKWSF